MFSSEAYGQKNLLFKDSTSELVPIATQTYEAWLGREYLHAVKGLLCDPNRTSAWGGHWQRTLTPRAVPLGLRKSQLLPPPASGGLGRRLLLSCMGCCIPDAPYAPRGGIRDHLGERPLPSTRSSADPSTFSAQCLTPPPPTPQPRPWLRG